MGPLGCLLLGWLICLCVLGWEGPDPVNGEASLEGGPGHMRLPPTVLGALPSLSPSFFSQTHSCPLHRVLSSATLGW